MWWFIVCVAIYAFGFGYHRQLEMKEHDLEGLGPDHSDDPLHLVYVALWPVLWPCKYIVSAGAKLANKNDVSDS